jgi:predicted transcriptional regulator
MSVIELRKHIISKVNEMEDEVVLHEIHELIKMEAETESVYKLTDQEKIAIEIGLRDIREGRIASSEEANERIAQWLKK